MKKFYNQAQTSAVYNGYPLQGLGEGASISIEIVGGEVDITEGTDGGSLNQATEQGAKVNITFKETSDSIPFLESCRSAQKLTSSTSGVLVISTGAQALHTLTDCLISPPQELSTGDKKMGSIKYTFVSTNYIGAF